MYTSAGFEVEFVIRSCESELKELYSKKINLKISNRDFVLETREYSKLAILRKQQGSLEPNEIKLLRLIFRNYLDCLDSDKKSKLELEDIKVLVNFSYEGWWNAKLDQEKFTSIVFRASEEAAALKSGSLEECKEILYAIENYFDHSGYCSALALQSLFKTLVRNAFLQHAVSKFNKYKKEWSPKEKKELLCSMFVSAINRGSCEYLAQFIEKFEIDFNGFTITPRDSNMEPFSPLFLVLKMDKSLRKEYLRFCINSYSEKDKINSEKLDGMTLLLHACSIGSRDLVDLLIEHGADINQEVIYTNQSGLRIPRTAFSISAASVDIEFVKYIVSKGASPIKAISTMKDLLNLEDKSINMIPIMSFKKVDASKKKDFLFQYYNLIEDAFIKELLTSIGKSPAKEFLGPTESQKEIESQKPPTFSKATNEFLESYIGLKKLEQKDNFFEKEKLEIKFDLLLMEYCKTGSDNDLEILHKYIDENPELNYYPAFSLVKREADADTSTTVLMNQPALLHRFFVLKKDLRSGLTSKSVESLIPDGVYKINSNLKNDVYVTISEELKTKLGDDAPKFLEKLQSCKFIKHESKGLSGVKTYRGLIKLKITGQDVSISTKTKYVEESTHRTLIIFEEIRNHKDPAPNSSIEIRNVKNIFELYLEKNNAELQNSENNSPDLGIGYDQEGCRLDITDLEVVGQTDQGLCEEDIR